MNDIQGPLTDLRTFINGANLTDTNVTAAGLSLSRLVPLVLYGIVDGALGTAVFTGSGGWSSARTGAGLYTITFSPAFSVAPVLLLTPIAAAARAAVAANILTGSAPVSTFTTNTAANADTTFCFFAIGPR